MFFRVRSDGKKEEVQSSNFIQKYFDVISIDYSGGTSIFNMVETSSNEKIVLNCPYNKITNNQTLENMPTKISFPKINDMIMIKIEEWNDNYSKL